MKKNRLIKTKSLLHGIKASDSEPILLEVMIIEKFGKSTRSKKIKKQYSNEVQNITDRKYEIFLHVLTLVDIALYNLIASYVALT